MGVVHAHWGRNECHLPQDALYAGQDPFSPLTVFLEGGGWIGWVEDASSILQTHCIDFWAASKFFPTKVTVVMINHIYERIVTL